MKVVAFLKRLPETEERSQPGAIFSSWWHSLISSWIKLSTTKQRSNPELPSNAPACTFTGIPQCDPMYLLKEEKPYSVFRLPAHISYCASENAYLLFIFLAAGKLHENY